MRELAAVVETVMVWAVELPLVEKASAPMGAVGFTPS